jgi:large subunit ribosomal protein L35
MPKRKTHKGLAKRVKVSATGKVRHKKSFSGHLMSTKSGNRRRSLRKPTFVSPSFAAHLKSMLGL